MIPNPPLGVLLHATGGLMSAIFYLPYRKVRHWSWESYWIVGGVFSWLVVPWIMASLTVPNLLTTLSQAPAKSLFWSYCFGVLWGIGGALFGLTVRYLGFALGTAMALGYCAAFGTLLPPIFNGEFLGVLQTTSGLVVMGGVVVCLLGIVISGLAGMAKERELPEQEKKASVREFSFKKGVWVATFCGVMSACMSYGFAAGKPIAEVAVANGSSDLWKNLPVLIIVLAGGFTTNFIWCVALNLRNKSFGDYLKRQEPMASAENPVPRAASVPLLANYLFCALAGTLWYLQFFFYGMGTTKMGRYDFSSWTLHMASIIIFGTLLGVFLSEWKGVSGRTHGMMRLGLVVLISSTVVIGYGNYLAKESTTSVFRLEADPARARLPVLSWDTEGGDRAGVNLLRTGTAIGLRVKVNGQWSGGEKFATQVEQVGPAETRYRLAIAPDADLEWRVRPGAGQLTMTFLAQGAGLSRVKSIELGFPFDPRVAATTLLPSAWDAEGTIHLPAIISAPDFGQMLLAAAPHANLKGRLVGSRANHTVDFTVELPAPRSGEAIALSFEPVRLPMPAGLKDKSLWRATRRGWFNAFQPSAQWGDQGNRFSAPPGILANNVISDPVSCLIHLWADQALLTPRFAADIPLPDLVQRTVDWWLDNRTKPTGEVIAYWNHADMLDANASPLIAAWDYVEATADRRWLARRIERLEFIAEYLVKRDVDNDGLVESTHSGNYGTLMEPMRAGSAYDTINAGHKDAYCNALIYRAFRCLADLEKQLKRREQQTRYAQRADRLKAAYSKSFFNPRTGWLAWWKSEDGELHDLSSPLISSLAICYGLVERRQGRQMLDQLWTKIEAAGFKRFDLGVPITLTPVRRGDYLIGFKGCGVPKEEDGSDTFGQYLNGGCLVSDAVYFITALHIVGEGTQGDRILRAMVERQERGVFPNGGGFQNGVVNAYPQGAEFYTWDGQTCGYEGHLTYSYAFLQAVLLREAAFRARLLRPLQ